MNKPFRTGILFGAGAAIAFVTLLAIVNVAADRLDFGNQKVQRLYVMGPGAPTILRAEPTLRGPQVIVLVTVRNPHDESIFFSAEAVLFDRFGEFYDICPGLREFHVAAGQEFSFKATCPLGGTDSAQVFDNLGRVDVQFFRT
jgi:hypothetical protein